MTTVTEHVDLIIKGWYVVTMNDTRDIIRDGAVAVRDNKIVAVDKASQVEATYSADRTLGGDQYVVTPGMVNSHIHVTGEPLTRGYVPDDTPFEENVFMWLCPLYAVYDAAEERLSAQLAAVEMLKSGTTSFLEAGTIRFLDEVIDGLVAKLESEPHSAAGLLLVFSASRIIERIADHATNIAEDVIYYVEGRDIRHSAS